MPGIRSLRPSALPLALLLILLAASARVPICAAGALAPEITGKIDATVEEFMRKEGIPGISLALASDGEIKLAKGYGMADVENSVPATEKTVHRLASISKMFTAVAAMQLAEQGKLDLSAPVQKYVPEFPEKQKPITPELLLKHQSGIRHYKGNETLNLVNYTKIGNALKIFKDEPLLFDPGDKFSYTTYGYCLLGSVIEGASGTDYVTYVTDNILKPSGIETMRPDDPYKLIPNRARGYTKGRRVGQIVMGGELSNCQFTDVTNKIPGGGWCSTASDLTRFAIALDAGKLLKRETLEKMWNKQKTAKGELTDSGLGCFVGEHNGRREIFHSGGQQGTSTFLLLCPDQKFSVALMCNQERASPQPVAFKISNLFLDAKP